MEFFKNALLPERKAKVIISSCEIGNIKGYVLNTYDKSVNTHADLSICHLGKNRFVTPPCSFEYYKKKLPGADIIIGEYDPSGKYPFDASYCACVFGNYAVANEKITDPVLLKILKDEFDFISVNQGYAKCNICPVSENAVITEDEGIEKKLSSHIDVLLIKKGYVQLKGHPYGFIGGATGMIGKNTLYFNGELKNHPDREKIYEFLEKYSVKAKEGKGAICDVGSIISVS